MVVHRAKIISLVMQHKVRAISDRTLPTERGGLVSYGPALEELFLGAALYADRILCGANQQSFRFRASAINLRIVA